MRLYRAYGLILACERELPFAAADPGKAADVTIVDALGQAPAEPSNQVHRELRRDGESWSLRYRNPEGGWLHFDHDVAAKTLAVVGSESWSDAVPVLAGVACAVLLSSAGTPLLHGAGWRSKAARSVVLGDFRAGEIDARRALLNGRPAAQRRLARINPPRPGP